MIIDHSAQIIYLSVLRSRGITDLYSDPAFALMIYCGRLAFPIFAFLLAEGAHYSHSRWKYALRLAALAVLSAVPFSLAFGGCVFTLQKTNVFVTLLGGLASIIAVDQIGNLTGQIPKSAVFLFRVLAVAAICVLCYTVHSDYGFFGVLLILIFYLLREHQWRLPAIALLFPLLFLLEVAAENAFRLPAFPDAKAWFFYCFRNLLHEAPGLLTLIPISFYNGKKGSGPPKLFHYLFYPLHLLALVLLREVLL